MSDRIIKGWASVEVKDRQGDVVEIGAFKKSMSKFMEMGGPIIDTHTNKMVGKVTDYEFKDKGGKPGLLITAEIFKTYEYHDVVWKSIQDGDYTGFSMGGVALDKVKKCNNGICANFIKGIELFEISVVDRPANQEAVFEEVSMAKCMNCGHEKGSESEPTEEKGEKHDTTKDHTCGCDDEDKSLEDKIESLKSLLKYLKEKSPSAERLVKSCGICRGHYYSLIKKGKSPEEALGQIQIDLTKIHASYVEEKMEETKMEDVKKEAPPTEEAKEETSKEEGDPMADMNERITAIEAAIAALSENKQDEEEVEEEKAEDEDVTEEEEEILARKIDEAVEKRLEAMKGIVKTSETTRPDLAKAALAPAVKGTTTPAVNTGMRRIEILEKTER